MKGKTIITQMLFGQIHQMLMVGKKQDLGRLAEILDLSNSPWRRRNCRISGFSC